MCASMDEVKQREALIDQLKNNCSDDLGDIVGLLLNFKNSGKQVIASAEAVCVASAKILNEATQLGDSKQELANILTLEKPEKEHVTVALKVMAQLVSTDDGAEAKNTEQVKQELSAILESVAVAIASYSLGAWAQYFSEGVQWAQPISELGQSIEWMLVNSRTLLEQIQGEHTVDKEAVKFCCDWCKQLKLLDLDLASASGDEMTAVECLGKWNALQAWREKYSIGDAVDSDTNASKMGAAGWALLNSSLSGIQDWICVITRIFEVGT